VTMNIGCLGMRSAVEQKPTKRCDSCGLRYPKEEPACTHCKDITTVSELLAFKREIESKHIAGSNLGKRFIVVGLVLGLILFLSF
jgi:hypothetical protein